MFICLMPHTTFLELLTQSKVPPVPQFPQLEDKKVGLNDSVKVFSGPRFLDIGLPPAPSGIQNQPVRILGQGRSQRGCTYWTRSQGHCPERCWPDAEQTGVIPSTQELPGTPQPVLIPSYTSRSKV